jgi:dTDP-4-dehydrorhamnose reductase
LKVLLFGKSGQVGWELQRSLSPLGELIAVDFDPKGNPDGLCGNFSDLPGLAKTIQIVKPDVIVNAAAHTAVDKAETELDFARTLNALAPGVLAAEANKLGAWLVHYSTDYVFDGSGDKPWREDDITGPLSVYGQTKLEGEQAVAHCKKHLILRTSWVYAAKGGNFAKTMLRLAKDRDQLTVIDDQVGAPTAAELLADVTALALRTVQDKPELAGLYHCAARGETSWFGYCRHVLAKAQTLGVALKAGPDNVTPIPTSSYPTPAKRPLNSRLNTDKIEAAFDLRMPNWQVHMDRMLDEICGGITQ